MSLRLLALLTGKHQSDVEPLMEADRDWAAQMLKPADHIMWEFDSSPTLKDIEDAILASRERLGEDVRLIVLDNAVDVTMDSQDEWGGLRTLMKELKWWANSILNNIGSPAVQLRKFSTMIDGRLNPRS